MQAPRICIAGIEVESKVHLRPVTDREQPLTRELLAESGGPFEVGALVDLGSVEAQPNCPEMEDHRFSPASAEHVRQLAGDEYLQLIDGVCHDTLEAAFGPDLHRREWKYAVDAGHGECSLACVRAQVPPEVMIDDRYGKVQMRFNDPDRPAFLTVTDLRLYEADQRTPQEDAIVDVQRRLQAGVGVRIMFGLARAFTAAGDDADRHWLQVNGLCLEDRPLGPTP